jgi:hypothetical protein
MLIKPLEYQGSGARFVCVWDNERGMADMNFERDDQPLLARSPAFTAPMYLARNARQIGHTINHPVVGAVAATPPVS